MIEVVFVFGMFIIGFTALFAAWFLIRNARTKERLMLIEKGININDPSLMSNKRGPFPWLRIGIVLSGIAIGCIIVSLILIGPVGVRFYHMPAFPFGVIVLSGGLSMILANFVDRPKDQK
jgi:hypothetical protein